jgi:hypothetical protein
MEQHGERQDAQPPERAGPGTGWTAATFRALLAAALLLALAEAVIFLAYVAANNAGRPSAGTVARYGGVLFYAFHHVGLRFESASVLQSGSPFSIAPSGVIAFAAMTGMALGIWMLYLGGRAVARHVGGSTLARGLHGLKVAAPYGALTFAGSFLLRFQPDGSDQAPIIHPSYTSALLWPLALAAAAGFASGVRSEHRDGWALLVADRETIGRRLNGALAGGWWMTVLGLIFAFCGLLVLAAVRPHATDTYFSSFDRGTLEGILAIVATVLVLPNLAAWVLFPAMGSCVGLSGPLSICFLSYRHFPRGPGALATGADTAALNLPSAPIDFYLFLLVPLAAVLIGGAMGASKGRATSRSEAAALGALAGAVFAALSALTIVLASLTVSVSGPIGGLVAGRSFRIGPELTSGVLLALVWGVAGGALGGLWEGRELPPGVPAKTPEPEREPPPADATLRR